MILAGDIGGTKTNLGLFESRDGGLVERRSRRYASGEFDGLDAIVRAFLADGDERPERAAFGVAGPVVRGRSEATNLSWVVDAAVLESALGFASVVLVNDLVATAAGLLDLPDGRVELLFPGRRHEHGTRAVIAPGTGLGEAALIWDGEAYHPLPSEGGHADFAPRNALEIALLEYLLGRQPRVSYEHVLAGPGLSRIYDFLRDTDRFAEPAWLAERLERAADRNAAITDIARDGGSEICVAALDLWAALLGAEAGNLALRALAIGGVFLGGGIVVKLREWLRGDAFLDAYRSKGRLAALVEKIPVGVILEERTALLGAARIALGGRLTAAPLGAS